MTPPQNLQMYRQPSPYLMNHAVGKRYLHSKISINCFSSFIVDSYIFYNYFSYVQCQPILQNSLASVRAVTGALKSTSNTTLLRR